MMQQTEAVLSAARSGAGLQCALFLCVIFAGIAFGALLRILFFRKLSSFSQTRFAAFSLFCLALTVSAILYTVLIFLTRSLFPASLLCGAHVSQGFSARSYYLAAAFLFCYGILLAAFWKLVIPLSLVLYAALAVFTQSVLNAAFGRQHLVIPVLLDANAVVVGDMRVPRGEGGAAETLTVTAYTLPDALVLPMRRSWISVSVSGLPPEADVAVSGSMNALALRYLHAVLLRRAPQTSEIAFPTDSAYPSLFSVHVSFHDDGFSCELVRDL